MSICHLIYLQTEYIIDVNAFAEGLIYDRPCEPIQTPAHKLANLVHVCRVYLPPTLAHCDDGIMEDNKVLVGDFMKSQAFSNSPFSCFFPCLHILIVPKMNYQMAGGCSSRPVSVLTV